MLQEYGERRRARAHRAHRAARAHREPREREGAVRAPIADPRVISDTLAVRAPRERDRTVRAPIPSDSSEPYDAVGMASRLRMLPVGDWMRSLSESGRRSFALLISFR